MKRIILLLTLFLTLVGCNQRKSYYDNNNTDSSAGNSTYEEVEEYPNDSYEAKVKVYNPNTGYEATYTLDVEAESGKLTKIIRIMVAG